MSKWEEPISMCVIYGDSFAIPAGETVLHEEGSMGLPFRAPLLGERYLSKFGNVCFGLVAAEAEETKGLPRVILASVPHEIEMILISRFVARLDEKWIRVWH